MKAKEDRLYLSIAMALVMVIFIASVSVSLGKRSEPLSITVSPEVPTEGAPVLITIKLNNPLQSDETVNYVLYGNGVPLTKGVTMLPGEASKKYTYVYPIGPDSGERTTFLVRAETEHSEHEKSLSLPAYPPQVWSSFVSFASFSTSLMGSSLSSSMGSSLGSMLTSVDYYKGTFVDSSGPNIGIVHSVVLILLLVFLELTEPVLKKNIAIRDMRLRFSRLSMILFTVFMGMVFTKVTMILR